MAGSRVLQGMLSALFLTTEAAAAFVPTTATRATPLSTSGLSSWEPRSYSRRSRYPSIIIRSSAAVGEEAAQQQQQLDEIRTMRVKELKSELESLGIGTVDAFEKEELVRRLFKARVSGGGGGGGASTTASSAAAGTPSSRRGASTNAGIRAPLTFLSLDDFRSVAASNADVFVRPATGQFATLAVGLPSSSSSDTKSLNLLVDTACSGLVLRPSSVQEHGIRTFSGPGAMLAAGGTAGSATFAQVDGLELCSRSFGAMPAAVQDIGALPTALDGIIGLSFLGRFACVEFDFRGGMLNLYDDDRYPPGPSPAGGGDGDGERLAKVAEADMQLTSLGIYVADVTLDGRGPVKMLVDTGAASTLLNWRGVSDMDLSRDSPLISRNADAIGAIGADNVALHLTHRYILGRRFGFGGSTTGAVTAAGGVDLDGNTLNIDIGDIPVLDMLQRDGVGGILGADLLMQCDVVRLNMKGASKIILYK